MVEKYDVLVLGAGPSGIAAARHLMKADVSFAVLEARSRVGGRVFACNSFGKVLDHGARWIHGSCADNSMVKLVAEMTFDHPEDAGVDYEKSLPQDTHTVNGEMPNNDAAPPFELSDSETEEERSEFIVRKRNGDIKPAPTKNLTKVLIPCQDGSIAAKRASDKARKIAKTIFRDIVQSVINDPQSSLKKAGNCARVDQQTLDDASLMDVLLWLHQGEAGKKVASDVSEEMKRNQFSSLCREQLVMNHELVERAVVLLESQEDRTAFREEVMALFNLEVYTVLECWEGAPIHRISARNGMDATCLPGGNMLLPFGYGGLIKRLAYPLENNHIHYQHSVVSLISNTANHADDPRITVHCQVASEDGTQSLQEFHASACIVALPLGVLRAAVFGEETLNKIVFEPPLPPPLILSIQSLGIAIREKIELLFETCWWPKDIGRFSLACAHLQQSPTYHPYSTFIVESSSHLSVTSECPNILVCYVAGEHARDLGEKTNDQIQAECMAVLRQSQLSATGETIPDPIAINVTRWLQDPYSRGSWTFYGKGSSPDDVIQFRENPECAKRHLYFAGEHTCHGRTAKGDNMGCVHGAWVSGEIAAAAAMMAIAKS